MARRNKNEGIFDIMVMLPWWLTLIVGVGIWVYLKVHPLPNGTSLDTPVFVFMRRLSASRKESCA